MLPGGKPMLFLVTSCSTNGCPSNMPVVLMWHPGLQVLLHCCQCCPALCGAAAAAGLPETLLHAACSSSSGGTAALSLLTIAAMLSGVGKLLPTGPAGDNSTGPAMLKGGSSGVRSQQQQLDASWQAVGPSQTSDAAIVRLAGEAVAGMTWFCQALPRQPSVHARWSKTDQPASRQSLLRGWVRLFFKTAASSTNGWSCCWARH